MRPRTALCVVLFVAMCALLTACAPRVTAPVITPIRAQPPTQAPAVRADSSQLFAQAKQMGWPEPIPGDSQPATPIAGYRRALVDPQNPASIQTVQPDYWFVPVLSHGRLVAYYEVDSRGATPTVAGTENVSTPDTDPLGGLEAAKARMRAAMGPDVKLYFVGGVDAAVFGVRGSSFGLTYFQLGIPVDPGKTTANSVNTHDVYIGSRALTLVREFYAAPHK